MLYHLVPIENPSTHKKTFWLQLEYWVMLFFHLEDLAEVQVGKEEEQHEAGHKEPPVDELVALVLVGQNEQGCCVNRIKRKLKKKVWQNSH